MSRNKSKRRSVHIENQEWQWVIGYQDGKQLVFITSPDRTMFRVPFDEVYTNRENFFESYAPDDPGEGDFDPAPDNPWATMHPTPGVLKKYIIENLVEV